MERILIFSVIASLAQGTYIPTLNVSYGLSEEEVAVLDQIIINQDTAGTLFTNGFLDFFNRAFFDSISPDNKSNAIIEAFSGQAEAFDSTFETIPIALGGLCSSVEINSNRSSVLLSDVITRIISSVELADSGSDALTVEAIEINEVVLALDVANVINYFYESVEDCVNYTDADLSGVIAEARNESFVAVVDVGKALFNAIKVYAVADDTEAIASNLTVFRDRLISRLTNNQEYEIALLKTLYLYPRLNQDGILSGLATNQYALTYSYDRYKEAYGTLFQIIIDYSTRIQNGSYNDVDISFSESTDAISTLITEFAAVGTFTLDSILVFDSEDQTELDEFRQEFDDGNIDADITFVQAIFAAVEQGDDYSATLEQINSYRSEAVTSVADNTETIFVLVRNNKSWGNEIDAEVDGFLQQATYGIELASNKFFDGVEILARNVYTGSVTEADLTAYDILQDEALAGVANFLQALSAAGVSVLEAATAS